jgi:hypothetical protein
MALQLTRRNARLPVGLTPHLSVGRETLRSIAPSVPRLVLPDPATYSTPEPPPVEDANVVMGAATGERPRRIGVAPQVSAGGAAQQRYFDIASKPIEVSRFKSGAAGAADAVQSVRGTDSLGLTIGAILGGFGGGFINKKRYGEKKRAGELAQAARDASVGIGIEKAKRDAAYQDAQTQRALADAEQLRARPGEQAAKTAAQAAKDAQAGINNKLRLLNGVPMDAANPEHVALMANLGITPEQWNNSKNNLISIKEVDPDNPTQTRNVLLNKVTGERTALGQAGYVPPIHADTEMTGAQEAGVELGKSRLGQGERHFQATREDRQRAQAELNANRRALLELRRNYPTRLGKASESVSAGVRTLGSKIAVGVENNKQSSLRETDPAKAQQLKSDSAAAALSLQADPELAKIYDSGVGSDGFGYVKNRAVAPQPDASTPPARLGRLSMRQSGQRYGSESPSGGGGAYRGQSFSRANLTEAARMLGVKSTEEAERIITREGGRVFE